MQTNQAVEQNKNIKWSDSPWNQRDQSNLRSSIRDCHLASLQRRSDAACLP